jgi:arylsulfatase
VAPNTPLAKGADPYDLNSYRKYTLKNYAPDLMFQEITGFVMENKEKPFFLFWTTPIPHAAIQAPQRWVDYYVKKFGDEKPYTGNQGYFPHRYPHAGYAAMISYLDEQVGQLVQQLKELGIYENTLIIFTSDNGPTYTGGTDSPWFNSGGPFKCEYGWGKGFTHEGGMRVPMIASWPAQIKKARTSDHVSGFQDVLPTFCDLANIKTPDYADGISFLPELKGKKQNEHEYLYWEFPETGGQQAIRMGKWKGIRQNIAKGNLKIELFDLETDLQELNDISASHPEIVKKMEQIMAKEHVQAENPRFRMKAIGDQI